MRSVSRDFLEILAAAAVAAAFFLAGVHNPAIGPLAAFFSPAPLIWLTYRLGPKEAAPAIFLSVAMTMPFLPLPAVLSYGFEHAFPGWLLGLWLSLRKSVFSGSLSVTVVILVSSLAASLALLWVSGLDAPVFLHYQVTSTIRETQGVFKELAAGQPLSASSDLQRIMDFLTRAFPAMIFTGVFLECAANSLLVLKVLSRNPASEAVLPSFGNFRLPEWLIWLYIPSLAASWSSSSALAIAALNITLVLTFFYLIQGLSITVHFLGRSNRYRIFRMLLVVFLLIQPYLLIVPLVIGLLDFRFDFRERMAAADRQE